MKQLVNSNILWNQGEYWQNIFSSGKPGRETFCHYSPSGCSNRKHKMMSTTLLLNIWWRNKFRLDLVDILKYEFMPAILFCFDRALFTPEGVNVVQLLGDSQLSK